MKKFIIYIILAFSLYIILLEVTTRVFDLSEQTVPEANLNNNMLLKPNTEGVWVKGGMREIASHYKINNQGFNSLKDYTVLDSNKINIAIIGDSFIEGFHTDVENSIGRLIEADTRDEIEVHEYGKSGGNIVDFSLIFKQWIKNRYDYTFILISDRDLDAYDAFFMEKGNKIPKNSIIRKIYNHLSSIRYININHGLHIKLKEIFSCYRCSKNNQNTNITQYVNSTALQEFDKSCVFIYEKDKLSPDIIATSIKLPCLEIIHQNKPHTYGFDSHWNLNGRKNCAWVIEHYIKHNIVH
ncbi:hypothetical protein [uncultured Formosa sp.]|uniref:hypothetical protein n=1 Tax=uncultured Formosa sp. TaxID=255435 RepID=UPI00261B1D27|nr:hypothetical protein [uncultured Formosa sp.]